MPKLPHTADMALSYLAGICSHIKGEHRVMAKGNCTSGPQATTPTQDHCFERERWPFNLINIDKHIKTSKMKKQEYVQNQRTRQIPTKEIEISNLLDKDFKVMVIKKLTNLGRRMCEYSKNFNKERKYKKVPNRSYNITEK